MRARRDGGFTLIEVMAAMMMLSIMGALAFQLVLAMMETKELTIRYEQIALSARTAAERMLDQFHESDGTVPSECGIGFFLLEENLEVAYECEWLEEEGGTPQDGLYEVQVWLRRPDSELIVAEFTMLAIMGGYN